MKRDEAEAVCPYWTCSNPGTVPWQTPDEAIEDELDGVSEIPAVVHLSGFKAIDGEECADEPTVELVYEEDVDAMAWIKEHKPWWLD